MTISDGDEIVPLIDHNRRDQGESNLDYQSLLQSSRFAFLKKKKDGKAEKAENSSLQDFENCRNVSGASQMCINAIPSTDSLDQRITYSWKNLSVYNVSKSAKFSVWRKISSVVKPREFLFEQPRQILKNVFGVACPGEFLAIMGGSGAGKTTLLNALRFQTGPNTICKGTRYLNGIPVVDQNTIAKLSAYVEQDNLFIGTLTVKEHLTFQSLVRIGRSASYREKLKRVEDVITELGLEKCQNTVIGYERKTKGISGGEKKRLAFASEILTNPLIMFCDEPTSGLDSFMALNVINVLKSMAIKGKTVICTIHQPSSEIFSLFDKILLVAEGRTVFLGKPNDAVSFFTELGVSPPLNYNPADFLMQLLAIVPNEEKNCEENIKFFCDSFEQSPQGMGIVNKVDYVAQKQLFRDRYRRRPTLILNKGLAQSEYSATWITQFRALFWRSSLNIIKEPLLVKVRLFQTVVKLWEISF